MGSILRFSLAFILLIIAVYLSINFFGPARGIFFLGLIFCSQLLTRPRRGP